MAYKYVRKTKDKIWMRVSSDKYELPEIVADSCEELARRCGTTVDTIYSSVHRKRTGQRKRSRYVAIPLEEDEV